MKTKKGYTLAEVLITLTVIGVIAAVSAPLISKYKPDTTKVNYLKTYDLLNERINYLANNREIYPIINNEGNYAYHDYPLAMLDTVTFNNVSIGGKSKLCKAFALASGLEINEGGCSDEYNSEKYDPKTQTPSFTTNNGVDMFFTTDASESEYRTDVYVDIDGKDKGKNCYYGSNCKSPDMFKFVVTADGKVFPNDVMGNEYLKTRSNWRKIEAGNLDSVENIPGTAITLTTVNYTTPTNPEQPYEEVTGTTVAINCTSYSGYDWGFCTSNTLEVAPADLDERMSWEDADQACKDLGMRLPKMQEFYSIAQAYKKGTLKDFQDADSVSAAQACYWLVHAAPGTTAAHNNAVIKKSYTGGGVYMKGNESNSTKRQVRCVK